MGRISQRQSLSALGGLVGLMVMATPYPGSAQTAGGIPPSVTVSLIAQDFSDCTNGDVKDDPNRTRGGVISVTRNADGTTQVEVAMTVSPDTTYHFFLKCVRLLGDIKTGDEGIGNATFSFPTNSVGNVFAFDMYPEGAPAGNKFQSMTVRFQ